MEHAQGGPQIDAEVDYSRTVCFLLLGKSGAGKSTLINAFVNHFYKKNYEDERLILIPQRKGQKCSFPKYEHLCDRNEITETTAGKSKTQVAHSYLLQSDERNMLIIDTPGIGDTRGFKQDQQNVQHIIEGIKKHSILQGVVCVIEPSFREDNFLKYYIDEIKKLLTKSCQDNIVVVCTRNTGKVEKELKSIFARALGMELSSDKWFAIDNKCLFGESMEGLEEDDSDDDDAENVRKTMEGQWEAARKAFGKIYETVGKFQKILTKDLQTLFEKRRKIENEIRTMIDSIEAHKAIFEDQLKHSNELKTLANDAPKFIEEEMKKKRVKPTSFDNYNCKSCSQTCIPDTSRVGYAMGSIFTLGLYHVFSEKADCDLCGHKNSSHCYEKIYRYVGLDAASVLRLAEMAEKALEAGVMEMAEEFFLKELKKIISEKITLIAKLTLEIEQLGVLPVSYDSFLAYLDDQIKLTEENMALDPKIRTQRIEAFKSERAQYQKIKKTLNDSMLDPTKITKEL